MVMSYKISLDIVLHHGIKYLRLIHRIPLDNSKALHTPIKEYEQNLHLISLLSYSHEVTFDTPQLNHPQHIPMTFILDNLHRENQTSKNKLSIPCP